MVLPSISEALFQSTLPSRGVTPAGSRKNDKQRISTHAPLLWNNWKLNFNPRSPRGERQLDRLGVPFWVQFQSTLPSRGATRPFSGCGGVGIFQSTLPSRGATSIFCGLSEQIVISIHAPLAGSDHSDGPKATRPFYFNPRSPRGERHVTFAHNTVSTIFQSTLPSRGATSDGFVLFILILISIHAPLAGSDQIPVQYNLTGKISIHAPLAGSDLVNHNNLRVTVDFNPRTPRGERHLSVLEKRLFRI